MNELEKWSEIRTKIKSSYDLNTDWELALELFENRITKKFLDPIELLIESGLKDGEGFAILTVQCALVESFASFRTGQIFNYSSRWNKESPKFQYWESSEIFIKFLHTAEIFKDNFWHFEGEKKVVNIPFNASEFYDKVRCGLMHEARTKFPWYINTTAKDVKREKVFVVKSDGKIKVLRTILHHRLKDHLQTYITELRQENQDGNNLRRLFARKLDHIFDIPIDVNFDWWRE